MPMEGDVPKDDEGWNIVLDNTAEVRTIFWHERKDTKMSPTNHTLIRNAPAKQFRDGSDEKFLQPKAS